MLRLIRKNPLGLIKKLMLRLIRWIPLGLFNLDGIVNI